MATALPMRIIRPLNVYSGEWSLPFGYAQRVSLLLIGADCTSFIPFLAMPKRAFCALAHMVLRKEEYVAKDAEEVPADVIKEETEEWIESVRIIRAICLANGIDCKDLKKLSLLVGPDWDQPGEDSEMVDLQAVSIHRVPSS